MFFLSFFLFSSFLYFFAPCGKFGSPYLGKAQQPHERAAHSCQCVYYFHVFLCVKTMVWLPVFEIRNVRIDVEACDCTRGLYCTDTVRQSALEADSARTPPPPPPYYRCKTLAKRLRMDTCCILHIISICNFRPEGDPEQLTEH